MRSIIIEAAAALGDYRASQGIFYNHIGYEDARLNLIEKGKALAEYYDSLPKVSDEVQFIYDEIIDVLR